jgi:phosphoserine aminotransferase
MSLLEWSHRSPEYDRVREDAEDRLRRLLRLPEGDPWRVLFLQGGASLQFAQVPMNLASAERPGGYIVTGVWAKKALEEAERLAAGRELWSGKPGGFRRLPEPGEWTPPADLAYVHVCTNNTVFGTQWPALPDTGKVPLVADMSSDILSRVREFSRCGLLYAGAQKNLGPAGLTIVVFREDLLLERRPGLPAILDYRAHVKADGIYNTPPTFAVWLMGKVLAWMEGEGGLVEIERRNEAKAALLYRELDRTGFHRPFADKAARSSMNVTWRLSDETLEAELLLRAESEGFVGLKGHRSVGGLRASLYNALPRSSVEALVSFLQDFERTAG